MGGSWRHANKQAGSVCFQSFRNSEQAVCSPGPACPQTRQAFFALACHRPMWQNNKPAGDSGGGRRPGQGSLKAVLTAPASVASGPVRRASPCFHRGEVCPFRGSADGEGGQRGICELCAKPFSTAPFTDDEGLVMMGTGKRQACTKLRGTASKLVAPVLCVNLHPS